MGCDIHLRVEYRAANETVGLGPNGEITVVPTQDEIMEFPTHDGGSVLVTVPAAHQGTSVWVPAEELTKNRYKDPDDFDMTNPYEKAQYESMPDFAVAYEDHWYRGRDYRLFTHLAGVRGDEDEAFWPERGLPEDVSDEIRADADSWGPDGHTPSWQTLEELESVDWSMLGNPEWMALLERMRGLAQEKCDGDQTAVRIVYWFDN